MAPTPHGEGGATSTDNVPVVLPNEPSTGRPALQRLGSSVYSTPVQPTGLFHAHELSTALGAAATEGSAQSAPLHGGSHLDDPRRWNRLWGGKGAAARSLFRI